MRRLRDIADLYVTCLTARFTVLKKSPVNLWFAFFLQLNYYAMQVLFWIGIRSADPTTPIVDTRTLLGFLVTLAVVDNVYLLWFGEGSLSMQRRILGMTLEPVLLAPRHPLLMFVFMHVNVAHLPATLLSLAALATYYIAYSIAGTAILVHIAAMAIGLGILNGISFLYRLTCFWTGAIVAVRNSNPSFKVMVRPLESFRGSVRTALLTIFPALFITGVPASLVSGKLAPTWVGFGFIAVAGLWLSVGWVWQRGVRRYLVNVV